jgi:outer membrane protein OmpA-like peptidoglycan-associated protein
MLHKSYLLLPVVFVLSFLVAKGQTTDTLTIHFDYNRSDIRPEDRVVLDRRLGEIRASYRITNIDLSGYCDSIGSDRYNKRLANERIGSVIRYTYSKNIQETPIMPHAYGRERPLNDNAMEEKRMLNRRVVIVFRLKPRVREPVTTEPKPADTTDVKPKDTPGRSVRPDDNPVPALAKAFQDTAVRRGKNVVLRDLNFYPGRHEPLPASLPVLDELEKVLEDNPNLRIEIQGHVCCVVGNGDGIDADSGLFDLSQERAWYVYRYLVQHGIRESRLIYKGYGASRKLYPEEKDEGERSLNRRVEIHVLNW